MIQYLTGVYESVSAYAVSTYTMIAKYFSYIMAGAGVTVVLTVAAVAIGFVFGTVLAIARMSRVRILSRLAAAYITFFRGTPLMVQLLFVYMGLPGLLGIPINHWTAAIAALGANSAAYVAEIVRSGIQSVEKGQREAGLAIGLRQSQVMRMIVLPQAFRKIIPALGNELVAMLKDSSLVSVISMEDLMRRVSITVTRTFRPIEFYGLAAITYLILTSAISFLVSRVERRLSLDQGTGSDAKAALEPQRES